MESKNRNDLNELLVFLQKKQKKESYELIKNEVFKYTIPIPHTMIPPGTHLYRARLHDKPNKKVNQNCFTKIYEFENKNEKDIIDYGRANEPKQSMFYCSTFRELAFFETSNISRNHSDDKSEIISYGEWILEDDIYIAALPINDQKQANITNEIVRTISLNISIILADMLGQYNNYDESLSGLLKFISSEFAKEQKIRSDYYISCAFANYVYEKSEGIDFPSNKKHILNGILYPSVQFSNIGVNLALNPELINQRKLVLKKAYCVKMEKDKDSNNYEEKIVIESKSIDHKNQEIKWHT